MKVVLDCHPFFTTLVVVVGWAIKTIVGRIIGGWVGDNGDIREARGLASIQYTVTTLWK